MLCFCCLYKLNIDPILMQVQLLRNEIFSIWHTGSAISQSYNEQERMVQNPRPVSQRL